MTVQEILDNLEERIGAAEARNVPGSTDVLEVNGRWHERFPGSPKQIVKHKDGRGIWLLTLDEARDLRDFLIDNLNSAEDIAEDLAAKSDEPQSTSAPKGNDAMRRLARGVQGRAPERRRRHGTEYPWEGV